MQKEGKMDVISETIEQRTKSDKKQLRGKFTSGTIALESEKKANKSKSDFLSRMSHDMRTLLNGIIGLLKIAEKHFDDRESDKPLSSRFLLNLLPHQIQ